VRDTVHDYKGVTLACNRDKQIQRTLEQMTWGMVCMVARGLLLLVMTINRFSQSWSDDN
jgi:hypothetical protein